MELAKLILEMYGRKTSVLYDNASITDLMEELGSKTDEASLFQLTLLANLMYFSLSHIFINKDGNCN